MSASNTINTKTIEALRAEWPLVEKVEHWVSFGGKGGIRKDLFGFADFVAVRDGFVLLVQATSWSNVSARVKKIRELPAHSVWLWSRHRFIEVWGWRKSKSGRWEKKVVNVTDCVLDKIELTKPI